MSQSYIVRFNLKKKNLHSKKFKNKRKYKLYNKSVKNIGDKNVHTKYYKN